MLVERDFKGMKIPPFGDKPNYDVLKDVPQLAEYNESPPNKRKIINYILLMYDPESPFVKRYQNVKKRIIAVCDYTGLSKAKPSLLQKIVEYNDETVISMIDEYVKWLNNRLWSSIVVNETAFYEYQREIMSAVTDDKSKDKLQALNHKTKVLEALDQISLRLDGYYQKLYANDGELEKISKTKSITPEAIAAGEDFDAD